MRAAAAAVLMLAACGRSDTGTGATCPHNPAFDRSEVIHVRAEARPTVMRRDLNLAALAIESGGSTGTDRAQGLTEVDHQLSLRTLVKSEVSRGKTCVWIEEVHVDLTPSSVQIFVPREYPENSCEDLAVLEHEREHVRVHFERMTTAALEIKDALTAAKWLPARGNPLEADDQPSAEAALNTKLQKVVTPVYEKYKTDLANAQADLDRPDLYQWVSKRCSGWK